MNWESWSAFFAMGGYALYVWGSFIVVFGCMAGEVMLLKLQGKSIRAQLVNARTPYASHTRNKS